MFYVFLQKLALNAVYYIMDKHVLREKLNELFAKLHQREIEEMNEVLDEYKVVGQYVVYESN